MYKCSLRDLTQIKLEMEMEYGDLVVEVKVELGNFIRVGFWFENCWQL